MANKITLLDKALKRPAHQRYRFPVTVEHAALAAAYFNGTISIQQFADAIEKNRGNAYCIVSTMLRNCVLQGHISVALTAQNGKKR